MDPHYFFIDLFRYQLVDILIITSAFLIGFFVKDGGKVFSALRFAAIGFITTAMIIFEYGGALYAIRTILVAAMILTILKCDRKYALPIAWTVTVCVFIGSSSLMLYDYFEALFSEHLYMPSYNFWGILFDFIFDFGFIIASTVIRVRRNKRERALENTSSYDKKNGMLVAGNILSVVSYAFFLIGIRCLTLKTVNYDSFYYYFHIMNAIDYIMIAAFVIAFVCGLIAICLLMYIRKRKALGNDEKLSGYEFTSIDTALYIWAWVVFVIGFIVVTVISIIMSIGDKNYKRAGMREVTDEKGQKRKLDYKGGDNNEALDENGEVWVTDDGGRSFRKRDTYVYTDDEGKDVYLRDKSVGGQAQYTSGRASMLEDKKGQLYDTSNWGEVEKRRDWDNEGILGEIRESEKRKAEIINGDE